ncbi:hypothetical protein RUND412_003926 [Rhizina undulata]
MDAFSAEILQEIVSYLFGSDLNSLRLVNHHLSAAATIFKFQALHVRKTRRGLENLLSVSRQRELARYVREITYPYGYLVPMPGGLESSASSGNMSPKTRFLDWYNSSYVAQIELENSGECIPTLETALSKMGNIRAIIPGHYESEAHDALYGRWLSTLTETEMDFVPRHRSQMFHLVLHSHCDMLQEEVKEAATKAFIDLINTMDRLRFKLDKFGSRDAEV